MNGPHSAIAHVGLIGCGRWGALILRDLKALGCRVTVAARSAATRQRATEGGAEVVSSIAELPALDGIVVATTTTTHAEVVTSVLDRRIPVFVEKPLSNSVVDSRRLAEQGAGRVFVMDKWRYHPGIRELGRIARTGELGSVVGLRTFRLGWGSAHDDVDSVWVLAPHDLSIALEILGHLLPARSAVAERAGHDLVGLIGLCGDSPWHALEVSSRRRTNRRAVQLLCQDGIAELDESYAAELVITRNPHGRDKMAPEPERREIAQDMPLLSELRAFVEHLRGGPPPVSDVTDGAAIVAAIADLRRLAGVTT